MALTITSPLSHFALQQQRHCDECESSSFGVGDKPEITEVSDSDCSLRREPRHVTFLVNHDQEDAGPVTAIHENYPMSEEERRALIMQPEDFKRCNEDVKRTVRNWLKHANDNEPFDHVYCTTRGLEDLIDHMQRKKGIIKGSKSQVEIRSQHIQDVLKEVKRQQSSKTKQPLDVDRIRQVSLHSAGESVSRSLELAEQDEEELRKIHPRWSVTHPRGPKRKILPVVQIQVSVQDDTTEANITKSIQKPLTSLNLKVALRRGSKLGSFLRRRK